MYLTLLVIVLSFLDHTNVFLTSKFLVLKPFNNLDFKRTCLLILWFWISPVWFLNRIFMVIFGIHRWKAHEFSIHAHKAKDLWESSHNAFCLRYSWITFSRVIRITNCSLCFFSVLCYAYLHHKNSLWKWYRSMNYSVCIFGRSYKTMQNQLKSRR